MAAITKREGRVEYILQVYDKNKWRWQTFESASSHDLAEKALRAAIRRTPRSKFRVLCTFEVMQYEPEETQS